MLLAVDIGNSRTKFGVFDGDPLISKWSVPTDEVCSIDAVSRDLRDVAITSAIACSVVPSAEAGLEAFIYDTFHINTRFVRNTDELGCCINHTPIESMGTDRVIAAIAAADRYGAPCVVISFGTATTIDVVNDRRELIGGLIAAGIRTSAKALAFNTARLPEVEVTRPNGPINVTTESAIQAGLFYSQVGLVENVIDRVKDTIKDFKVVATGGFAKLIASASAMIDVVDDDLVLYGLHSIWQRGDEG